MSSSENSDHQVVDLERALIRLAGNEEMLRDLIRIFLAESPRWLQEIEEAVAGADADAVFRAAHDIKGSTDIFCANSAVKAAQDLERMGRSDDLEGADEALGALKAEMVWVRNALNDFLKS